MDYGLQVSEKGNVVVLTNGPNRFVLNIKSELCVVNGMSVCATLSLDDELICNLPCIIPEPVIHTFVLAYKLVKCGVIPSNQSIGDQEMFLLKKAMERFSSQSLELPAVIENYEGNDVRQFYDIPFATGEFILETVIGNKRYEVRQSGSPRDNDKYGVRLCFTSLTPYNVKHGVVDQSFETTLLLPANDILPPPTELIRLATEGLHGG